MLLQKHKVYALRKERGLGVRGCTLGQKVYGGRVQIEVPQRGLDWKMESSNDIEGLTAGFTRLVEGTWQPWAERSLVAQYRNYETDTIESLAEMLGSYPILPSMNDVQAAALVKAKIEKMCRTTSVSMGGGSHTDVSTDLEYGISTLRRGVRAEVHPEREQGYVYDNDTLTYDIYSDATSMRICSAGAHANAVLQSSQSHATGVFVVRSRDYISPHGRRGGTVVGGKSSVLGEIHDYLANRRITVKAHTAPEMRGLFERTSLGEVIRHGLSRAHYHPESPYEGTQLVEDMAQEVRGMVDFSECLFSSRHESVFLRVGGRNNRRTRGAYESSWPYSHEAVGADDLVEWLGDPAAWHELVVHRQHMRDILLSYIHIVDMCCSVPVRTRYYKIMLMAQSERYGMVLPLCLYVRDSGYTEDMHVTEEDSASIGGIMRNGKLGAVVDVSWETSNVINIRRDSNKVRRFRCDYVRGKRAGFTRMGDPVDWYKSADHIQAMVGACTLLIAAYLAVRFSSGAFHFLWALVFSNMLHEEAALVTLPMRLWMVLAHDKKWIVATRDPYSHPFMVLTVGLVEVLYSLGQGVSAAYALTISIFWCVSLLTTPALFCIPFYREVEPYLHDTPGDMAGDDTLWNTLLLDPGAVSGFRCGGTGLYSGVALAGPRAVIDSGDKWKMELGHVHEDQVTVRLGQVVSVGHNKARAKQTAVNRQAWADMTKSVQ